MGFHFVEWIVLAGIILAIFGPKTLQSLARDAGKGVSEAKTMKDKLLAELPMDEISKMSEHIPQVPMNTRQAVQMLITPQTPKSSASEGPVVETPQAPQTTQVPQGNVE